MTRAGEIPTGRGAMPGGKAPLGRMLPGLGGLLLLGGCMGSLLGGGKPDALYRFGVTAPSAAPAVAAQVHLPGDTPPTVSLARIAFAAEVDGDRLLAVHGTNARYMKGMRWVSPAPELLQQAIERGFQARLPAMRLTPKSGGEIAGFTLVLKVSRFEARYEDAAMASPPTVVMEGDATLYRAADRHTIATRHFSAGVVADENRAGAVAAAFDQATALCTGQITEWVAAATAP